MTTEVKVAVGSPASFVATDVEYDSHEGNTWVGAAMRRGEGDRNDNKVGGCQSSLCSRVQRQRENVESSCKNDVKRKEGAARDRMVVKEIVKRTERKEAVWARRGEREHPRATFG